MRSFQHFLFAFLLFVSPLIQASASSEKVLKEKNWTKSSLKEIWSLASSIKTKLVPFKENYEDIEDLLDKYDKHRFTEKDCPRFRELIVRRENMTADLKGRFHDAKGLILSLITAPDTPESLQSEVLWKLMGKMQEEFVNYFINPVKVEKILGRCPPSQ